MLVFLAILFYYTGFSQEEGPQSFDPDYLKEHTPTSPEAASLGTYGNISNNPYNGKANVGVNLHTLNFDGLTIPIALNYDTGGVRVDADASWVGLNWSLSGTASITRRIYGNDDLNEGTVPNAIGDISARVFSDINILESNGETSLDFEDVKRVHNRQSNSAPPENSPDLAADIYQVSVFGESYSFYLKRRVGVSNTVEGHIFNDQYASITYNLINQSFELHDSRGFVFYFNTKNYTASASSSNSSTGNPYDASSTVKEHTLSGLYDDYNHSNNTVISAWNLDRIDSPDGNSLYFNYQEGAYFTAPQYSGSYKAQEDALQIDDDEIGQINSDASITFTSSMSIIHSQYLESITGDFGKIDFHSTNDRRDLLTGVDIKNIFPTPFSPTFVYITKTNGVNYLRETHGTSSSSGYNLTARKLNQITVSDPHNRVVKNINFGLSYFNSPKLGNPDEALYLRLKLDNVQVNEKVYSFDYTESDLMPNKMSFDRDFWGFYNGANNESTVPGVGRFMAGVSDHFVYSKPYWLYSFAGADHIPYGPEDLEVVKSLGEFYYEFRAANLSSNFNYGRRGNLLRIHYPTGGYTALEFEPNKALVDATLPYVVEDYYPGTQLMRWTNLRNEDEYNFTYLYLKYANDPNFSFFDHRYDATQSTNGISISPTTSPTSPNTFTVDYLSAVKAEGLLDTYTINEDQSDAFENVPKYYVENVHHPELIYPLLTFGDWYNSPIEDPIFVQRSVIIPPGTYRLRDAGNPIGSSGVALISVEDGAIGEFELFEGTIDGIDGFVGAEEFEVGGARVKSITNYDNTGAFINKKQYAYNLAGSQFNINPNTAIPSGRLMDDLLYHTKLGFYSYVPIIFNIQNQDNAKTVFSSNNVLGQSGSAQGSHVGYSEVTEYSLGIDNNILGAVKRHYDNKPNEYHKESATRMFGLTVDYAQDYLITEGMMTDWDNSIVTGLPMEASFDYSNGQVLSEEWFSCDGTLTKRINNLYEDNAIHTSDEKNAAFWFFPWQSEFEISPFMTTYHWFNQHNTYYIYDMPNHLAKESVLYRSLSTDFGQDGALPTVATYYNYDTQGNLTSRYQEDSEGGEMGTEYFYPYSSGVTSSFGSPLLRANNLYSQIVKSETYDNNDLLGKTALNFVSNSNTSGLPKVNKSLQSKGQGSFFEQKSYERFNANGKLIQSRLPDGSPVSYIWGYNEQYMVAAVANVEYSGLQAYKNQIDILSSQDDDSCGNDQNCNESALRNYLNAMQAALTTAQVTFYTYDPLVGVTSVTSPNGIVTYYVYDDFYRLSEVRDQDGNLLSKNEYNITNELMETLGDDAIGIAECGSTTEGNDTGGNPDTGGGLGQSGFTTGGYTLVPDTFNSKSSSQETTLTRESRNNSLSTMDTKLVEDGVVNKNYKFAPLNLAVELTETQGDGNIITYHYTASPYGGSGEVEYRWKIRGQSFSEFSPTSTFSYTFDCAKEDVRGLRVVCEVKDKILGVTYRDEIRHIVLCNN